MNIKNGTAKNPGAKLAWNQLDLERSLKAATSQRITVRDRQMGHNEDGTMAPKRTRVPYPFVYCCCSNNSRGADDQYLFHKDGKGNKILDAQVVRVTKHDDLAAEKTMQKCVAGETEE